MAVASDKARFFLEQTVPELREWEKREIFTKNEITSITSKRSDFEHVLNARGSKPADYARYVEYEMNLDSLRRKRVKRKGVKATAYTGQRRIFFILDRATRKFPGDVGLWMQAIEFARTQHSYKKLQKIFTDVLRMHPMKTELWIYAARYAMDVQADVGVARSYMQRGLRFCKTSQIIYLEYARLEMGYIAKIAARRKVLGLDSARKQTIAPNTGHDDHGADMLPLPTIMAGEIMGDESKTDVIDDSIIESLASTPVMSGAVPLAIFDAAMKQFPGNDALGVKFFDLFAEFDLVPCTTKILQNVVDHLFTGPQPSVGALSCRCKLPIIGVSYKDPGFPSALKRTLDEIRSATAEAALRKDELAAKILSWLSPMTLETDLGPELQVVLTATEARLVKTSRCG